MGMGGENQGASKGISCILRKVIGSQRASWRILSSIEQKEAKGNEQHVRRIREYRQRVEAELSSICGDIMTIIDEQHIIPSSSGGESSVFYYKMFYMDFSFAW